jgi:hypothetical protein
LKLTYDAVQHRTSQEFIMTSFASDFSSAGPLRNHVGNVGTTARAFIAALFSINLRPSAQPEQDEVAPVSVRQRAQTRIELQRMANQCESLMPDMASELRCIAARG